MKSAIMRVLRIMVAQGISYVLLTWGGISIPILGLSVGAVLNGIFKYIRDKYPKSKILEWLPI